MNEQDLRIMRPEIDALYKQAQSGQMPITVFFDELGRLGITDFTQAIHAANAFRISLGDAKKAFIERQPGGMEAWESRFDDIDFDSPPNL